MIRASHGLLLLGFLLLTAFPAVSFAYEGIEHPKSLMCGVKSSTFGKAILAARGELTGSAADALTQMSFPAGSSETYALSRAKQLNLECTRRVSRVYKSSGEQELSPVLVCKGADILLSICRKWKFAYALEPVVRVYFRDRQVLGTTFGWSF